MVNRARLGGRRPPRLYWSIRYGLVRRFGRRPPGARMSREGVPLPPSASPADPLRPTVLFYAIDGGGLGHLARCLSIARKLSGISPVFVTTCRRADVLDGYGIPYRSVPSLRDAMTEDPGIDRRRWQRKLVATLEELFTEHRPAALVSDAIAPDDGLISALRSHREIGRIGIRRAYRLDGRENLVLARDREYHELLIPHEPGEVTIPLPSGPRALWVGPLIVAGREDALTRDEARAQLGIPPDRLAILLQLGAGEIGRGKQIERALLDHLRARDDVQVVVTSYDPVVEKLGSVTVVHRFPMAELMAAFDLAVAAAGYNTYTELLHHGVPTIFVPNSATISDDQTARARRAEEGGAARVVAETDPLGVIRATEALIGEPELRMRLAAGARALIPRNGADAAAAAVAAFCHAVLTGAA
jgi:UDP:flavonoid glycosyltransferase YjiC (YdhE family)